MDQETPIRVMRIHDHANCAPHQFFCGAAGGGVFESFGQVGGGLFKVAIEGLAEQLLFVAEGSIQTWHVNAHGFGEGGQGSTFVAMPPEKQEGSIESLVSIKFSRASSRHNLQLQLFIEYYNILLDLRLQDFYL